MSIQADSTAFSARPVFIGGCGRSGTTLLGAMLGAHPELLCLPEAPFLIKALEDVRWKKTREVSLDTWKLINRDWRFRSWALSRDTISSVERRLPLSAVALFQELAAAYGRQVGRANWTDWIDHTPWNLRFACLLLSAYPGARLLHVVRDGRAVAASVMDLDWGPNTPEAAAGWWMESIAPGLAAEMALPSDRVLRVRYEDLVGNTEQTMESVASFLGIGFDSKLIEGGGYRPPRHAQQQHALVDKPPSESRIEAWRTKLDPKDIQIFESSTGDLLEFLGYSLSGLPRYSPSSAKRFLTAEKEYLFKFLLNPVRSRVRIMRAIAHERRRSRGEKRRGGGSHR